MPVSRRGFLATALSCMAAVPAEFLSYDRAEPVLRLSPEAWPGWIQKHDIEIRARLLRGEEDSLVNFVLFGVSFTDQPRDGAIDGRIRDFLKAIAAPGANERLLWLRDLVAGRGERYVRENISRYLAEQQQYQRGLDSAPAGASILSQAYKNRGLSIDTNFRPNYAIEQALTDLKHRKVLTSVRRAAIIGPGLDFTDKDRGFDYYPLQTLQPFALVDSLLRLGLTKLQELRLSVFDISPRTLNHLSQASSHPYTIQLVLDKTRPWNQGTLAYWHRFGDRVGTSVTPMPAPRQVQNVDSRAVRVRPEIVKVLEPRDLNIVTQHVAEQYDLIVATNIFVYYDALDQSLAMLNMDSMLRTGGILLSNNYLEECPGANLRSIGNISVEYSKLSEDADRVDIYSKSAFTRR